MVLRFISIVHLSTANLPDTHLMQPAHVSEFRDTEYASRDQANLPRIFAEGLPETIKHIQHVLTQLLPRTL